jgi:hypothetical protein
LVGFSDKSEVYKLFMNSGTADVRAMECILRRWRLYNYYKYTVFESVVYKIECRSKNVYTNQLPKSYPLCPLPPYYMIVVWSGRKLLVSQWRHCRRMVHGSDITWYCILSTGSIVHIVCYIDALPTFRKQKYHTEKWRQKLILIINHS